MGLTISYDNVILAYDKMYSQQGYELPTVEIGDINSYDARVTWISPCGDKTIYISLVNSESDKISTIKDMLEEVITERGEQYTVDTSYGSRTILRCTSV